MMVRQTLRFFVLLLGLAAVPVAFAQVRATLVAAEASVQPGRPITVALRLVHEEGWHTYWKNPGTGLATTIRWTLPEGWTAGPIQWPAPKPILDKAGAITGNGYDGDLLLPVILTPPATVPVGATVELRAAAEWLMCEAICIPGKAELRLSLPVLGAEPGPVPQWRDRIAQTVAQLPRVLPEWSVSAVRDERMIVLSVSPPVGTAVPREVRFYSEDATVAYERPQRLRRDSSGGFKLSMPVGPEVSPDASRLVGVLAAPGWGGASPAGGLAVDVAFAPAPPGFIAAWSAPETSDQGLGRLLLYAVVGGLILNLMPCVFPVLGIKILGFVNQSGMERRRVAAHGLSFAGGVMVSFWALAGILAALRGWGASLAWGFQLQSPTFVLGLTIVMLVFALNLSGLFEFGLRATAIGGSWNSRAGYSGSFLSGVLATVVATPCSAPFVAPAMGAALALPTGPSFAIFTAMAAGLAAPYLLLSLFPAGLRWLPRPGAWMVTFKQLMAFPLYATVGYLLWVLGGQLDESDLLNVFLGLTAVALGAWLYGRASVRAAGRGRAVEFALAAVAGVAGLWLAWPPSAAASAESVVWEEWSPEAVARLRADGRPIYVDFTARWCATCQANKKLVFGSAEVRQAFREKNVATLRADWTTHDARITAELENYGRAAVPFNQLWVPGRDEAVVLPEILTPAVVLEALQTIPAATAVSLLPPPNAAGSLPIPSAAPAWKLQDLDGNEVSSEQFKGRVVVLDFWATWCASCVADLPEHLAMQKKYAAEGLTVIGVSMDRRPVGQVKDFVDKMGLTYPNLRGTDAMRVLHGSFETVPVTFIIDRAGVVRSRWQTIPGRERYEAEIRALLAEPLPQTKGPAENP